MANKALRIVFAGTPDFAAAHLQTLLDNQHHVLAVYTQPDRPAGRGKKIAASEVKQLAALHSLPIYQPLNLKSIEAQTQLAALAPDLLIVVAYGLLLPQAVLDIPRLGCINVHASLLPRWRGAAPIQRALEAGDAETGVSIMQMEAGLDTGPVLTQQRCQILPNDTGGSLHDRLAVIGANALLGVLDNLDNARPEAQNHPLATYAHKLSKEEARLDFSRSAFDLALQISAFNPFPVSWCFLPNGERLRVFQSSTQADVPTLTELGLPQAINGSVLHCDATGLLIACGAGALLLTDIQLPNRKRMSLHDMINGHLLTLKAGDTLL